MMCNVQWLIRYIFPVFLIVMLVTTGCVQKEQENKDKPASVEKRKEDKTKEESDVVMLPQEMQKGSGIEVQKVAFEYVSAPLSATAVIEFNMDRSAKISPRVTGKIIKFTASQGDRVKAGQPLAYLDSVEVDQMWADYLKAQGRLELAHSNLKREEALFEKKVSPEKDVIKARQELHEAEADLNLAREKFRLTDIDISHPEAIKSNRNHPLIPMTSPISGVVVERMVSQGEVVSPEKVLFFVADLSSLWTSIDIYEKDISLLRPGSGASISVDAYPGRIFKGVISNIGDVVDEKTRTVKAKVIIVNTTGLLKPGMFASVKIENSKGHREKILVIPEKSIMSEANSKYVFAKREDGSFIKKAITIGRTFGDKVEISEGLKEGENFVASGAFVLKSELKKKELEAD